MFLVINWIAPDFYGNNWGHPWMAWGLVFAVIWMALGNLVMRRMINFRF
jgi:tight adherence protein B